MLREGVPSQGHCAFPVLWSYKLENVDLGKKKKAVELNITKYLMYEGLPKIIHKLSTIKPMNSCRIYREKM